MSLTPDSLTSRRPIGHVGRAAVLFAVLTVVLAYPLSVRPGSTVLANEPDDHLFIWTLAWDAHALASRPLSIFDATIPAADQWLALHGPTARHEEHEAHEGHEEEGHRENRICQIPDLRTS
jgi:hypothetical protein